VILAYLNEHHNVWAPDDPAFVRIALHEMGELLRRNPEQKSGIIYRRGVAIGGVVLAQ